MPLSAAAEIAELSQGQLRQLVQQQQVLGSEAISASATSDFGGVVVDIRGFLSDGRMTYRVLLQRDDGAVIELLFNGTDGQRVSHNSQIGQDVSSQARASNGRSNGAANGNAGANGNSGNNGKSDERGNSGSRGNSGGGGSQNGRGN